ncbi:MAG: hypothetical protein Q9M92_08355 [Enterobacterales bacterium]|nr:hypothetical protein [Enterobacterales bacterium]
MIKRQRIDLLQVGQGRIGQRLFNCLKQTKQKLPSIQLARLDHKLGLLNLESDKYYQINQLVICIAPPAILSMAAKSQFWKQIFAGLHKQVQSGQLVIQQLYFVSSTRVYDGIKCGMVKASSSTHSDSTMGQALIFAEQMLMNLSRQCYLFRAVGLVGESYPKYQTFLKLQDNKLRFTIADWQLVDQMILQIKLNQDSACGDQSSQDYHAFLMTDGQGYINGQVLSLPAWQQQVEAIKGHQRWLKASNYHSNRQ